MNIFAQKNVFFIRNMKKNLSPNLSTIIFNSMFFLEFIKLDLKNNKENLDNLLFNIILNCPKLKTLFFDGIVNEDMDIFHKICKYKQSAKGRNEYLSIEYGLLSSTIF